MPDRWVPVPDRAPFKCPFTQRDAPADGPYWEARLQYLPMDEQGRPAGRPHQLYLSSQAIREACQLPGSPLVAVDREAMDELLDRANRFEEEAADLAAELELARDEIENFKKYSAAPVDGHALVGLLRKELDNVYAKKPGPKAKT